MTDDTTTWSVRIDDGPHGLMLGWNLRKELVVKAVTGDAPTDISTVVVKGDQIVRVCGVDVSELRDGKSFERGQRSICVRSCSSSVELFLRRW